MAGQFYDQAIQVNPTLLSDLFWLIVMTTVGIELLHLLFNKPIRKRMGNIH